MSVIAPLKSLDKENGNTPIAFRHTPSIAVFNLLANTCTTIDRGTNCKELAGSLLLVSHDMRSCVTKLPVLAILAGIGSIPRNTDEY